ncbi:MAG TPA: DMT family transporter [Leptolinea sp.]
MSSNADQTIRPIRTTWYKSPTLVITIGIIAVSSAALFIRFAQKEMPSLVIAAYRLGFASILMTPWVLRQHRNEIIGINRGDWIRIISAGFLLAIHFASWISSLEYTSVSSSVVLVTTTPIWVALFSPIFLKEKTNRMTILGLMVAILGGVIVSLANECTVSLAGIACISTRNFSNSGAMLGDALALDGAICASFYLMISRVLRKTVDLSVYVYCIFSSAALFLIMFVLLTGKSFFPYSPAAFIYCLALAIFPQIVGHTSLNWALAYLPVGFVALVLLGEPVGSTILAAIFLKEIPTLIELIGGVTILTGIYLASRKPE